MEVKAAQSIATAVQTMPSQASSTTMFEATPAPNTLPNGAAEPSTSVKLMEVQSKTATNKVPSTSNAVKPPTQPANKENTPKASPAKSRSRSRPKKQMPPKSDADMDMKVEVSGYPVYAKPQDLYKVFSKYGVVRVEHVGRRFAVLAFEGAAPARAAIADSTQLCLFGQLLAVKPFAGAIDEQKKQVYKSKHTVVTIPPESIPLEGSFGEQLGALLAAVRLSQAQVAALAALYADLERVMQPVWPGCQAMPFGSITTGLGVQSSDADCFMNIPPHFRHASYNFVNKAKRILQQYPELFAEVFAIPRANTPIVKLFHLPTQTHCDLTFKTPLGALNSKLLAFLLHADPRLLPLAVLVKYWAAAHGLSGSGRLTNYALSLLLVGYLQAAGVLPAVAALQRRAPPVPVDGWDTGFLEDRALLPRAADHLAVQDLLGGFFRYYAVFDFETQVVCPYLGRPVPKAQFLDSSPPEEFARYARNVADNLVAPLRVRAPLCVQDPFEQCHNVASSVTPRMADELKAHLRLAAELYERERGDDCRGLLRAVLLEKPKLARAKPCPEYRVALPPRLLDPIAGDDWRAALRAAVFTIFERMLKLPLAPAGEREAARGARERERYAGSVSRPVWKRRPYARLLGDARLGFVERQARVTDHILSAERAERPLHFQLTLSFGTTARNASASLRLTDGDPDAFHHFGKYFLATMQYWVSGVLRDTGAVAAGPAPAAARADGDAGVDDDAGNAKVPKETPEDLPTEASSAPEVAAREAPERSPEEGPSPPADEAMRPLTPDC